MDMPVDDLRRAVESRYGTSAAYVTAVNVRDVLKDLTVWNGTVHLFQLANHPKTQLAYAWSEKPKNGDKPTVYCMLHAAPVTSAEQAVREALKSPRSGTDTRKKPRRRLNRRQSDRAERD